MIVYDRSLMGSSITGKYPELQNLYNTIKRETRLHMERVGKYCNIFYKYLCENYEDIVRMHVDDAAEQHSDILLFILP